MKEVGYVNNAIQMPAQAADATGWCAPFMGAAMTATGTGKTNRRRPNYFTARLRSSRL